eukprot:scaffold1610_cov257-Pinguiococcus_pyrenoidosus.AAC.32
MRRKSLFDDVCLSEHDMRDIQRRLQLLKQNAKDDADRPETDADPQTETKAAVLAAKPLSLLSSCGSMPDPQQYLNDLSISDDVKSDVGDAAFSPGIFDLIQSPSTAKRESTGPAKNHWGETHTPWYAASTQLSPMGDADPDLFSVATGFEAREAESDAGSVADKIMVMDSFNSLSLNEDNDNIDDWKSLACATSNLSPVPQLSNPKSTKSESRESFWSIDEAVLATDRKRARRSGPRSKDFRADLCATAPVGAVLASEERKGLAVPDFATGVAGRELLGSLATRCTTTGIGQGRAPNPPSKGPQDHQAAASSFAAKGRDGVTRLYSFDTSMCIYRTAPCQAVARCITT